MRLKDPNSATRQKIILESFKLFASKSLKDITFADIEMATGLSRGAILHHFKTKELIFSEVINKFVTNNENKLPNIDVQNSLWQNIESFVNIKRKHQDFFSSIGILNINRAYIHIVINGMTFSEEIKGAISLRREREIVYWKTLLLLAIENGEINKELNVELYAHLFINVFYGYSYTCMAFTNGYNLESLLEQFRQIYVSIKND